MLNECANHFDQCPSINFDQRSLGETSMFKIDVGALVEVISIHIKL